MISHTDGGTHSSECLPPLIREWRNSRVPCVCWELEGSSAEVIPGVGMCCCTSQVLQRAGKWEQAALWGAKTVPQSFRLVNNFQENHPKRAVQTCGGFGVCKQALAGSVATAAGCVWAGRRGAESDLLSFLYFSFSSVLVLHHLNSWVELQPEIPVSARVGIVIAAKIPSLRRKRSCQQ